MVKKDLGLFIITIIFLVFFYAAFNSDVFQNSFLIHFKSLMQIDQNGNKTITTLGNIVTMVLVIICYVITYIIVLNL
jgi:hypothetical protein